MIYLLLSGFIILLSCDESMILVNCDDCFEEEPTDAIVYVSLDDRGSMETVINIYEGDIEDNVLVRTTYSLGDEVEIRLKVNKRYTFCAVYQSLRNNNTIKVINSVYPRVSYETSQCIDPCYYIYDNKVRLKLKYKDF